MGEAGLAPDLSDAAKKLGPLAKGFSIVGVVLATGTLYSFGLYKPMGVPFSVLVDQSLIAQSIFSALLFVSLAFVAARFYFITSLGGRFFLPPEKIDRSTLRHRRREQKALRRKFLRGRILLRSADLRWHIKLKNYAFVWALEVFYLITSWTIDAFFLLLRLAYPIFAFGFLAFVFRDFISLKNGLLGLMYPASTYVLIVAVVEMSSAPPVSRRSWYKYRTRVSRTLARPKALLAKAGGITGLVFVYAAAVHAVGLARYHTLLEAPDTCAYGEEINVDGSLIGENGRGYFFIIHSESQEPQRSMFLQRDVVRYLVSPCLRA